MEQHTEKQQLPGAGGRTTQQIVDPVAIQRRNAQIRGELHRKANSSTSVNTLINYIAETHSNNALSLVELDTLIPAGIRTKINFTLLNERLKINNVTRYKSLFNELGRESADDAAYFLHGLSNKDRAAGELEKITSEKTLIDLFATAENEHLFANGYLQFQAYQNLYELIEKRKKREAFEDLLKDKKYHALSIAWNNIKKVNAEKEKVAPCVHILAASLSFFFAIEICLAVVNSLGWDSAKYFGLGEASDAAFKEWITPSILALSILLGIAWYVLSHSSTAEGTDEYYLEKNAEEYFNFESPLNRKNLGTTYYFCSRGIINVLPFVTMLGLMTTFELIFFELAELHETRLLDPNRSGILNEIEILPYFLLAIAIVSVATYWQTGKHEAHRKPFQQSFLLSSAIVFTFLAIMPLIGLDYNAARLLYSAVVILCGTFYKSAYIAEAADVLRSGDIKQLNKIADEKRANGLYLDNECPAVAKPLRFSEAKSNTDSPNDKTALLTKHVMA